MLTLVVYAQGQLLGRLACLVPRRPYILCCEFRRPFLLWVELLLEVSRYLLLKAAGQPGQGSLHCWVNRNK